MMYWLYRCTCYNVHFLCYSFQRKDSSNRLLRQFNIKDRHLTSPILTYPQTGLFAFHNVHERFNHSIHFRQFQRRVLRIKLNQDFARSVVAPHSLEECFRTVISTRSRDDVLPISFPLPKRAYLGITPLQIHQAGNTISKCPWDLL
jgi:hypothetical protein